MAPMDRMDQTWRDQNQANGNLDTDVLTKLGTIVEATRVAVHHVLRISEDTLQQTDWRATAIADPTLAPYTALLDFHRRVMTTAHPNSANARKPMASGDQASNTSGSGLPGQVMREVASMA